jgi:hypothetical protein
MDRSKDPLLRGTRFLLLLTGALVALGGIAALAAIAPLWAFDEHVLARLAARSGGEAVGRAALAAISVTLVEAAGFAALSVLFLRKLTAIVDSMHHGSPFVPSNAGRLRTMGWLALAMQLLAVLGIPLSVWLRQALANPHVFFPFSFAPLIVALLLFILARVFDHGVRLEEDVEGTI